MIRSLVEGTKQITRSSSFVSPITPPPRAWLNNAKADTLHPTIYVQLSHDADRNIENYVLIIQRSFKIFPTTFRYSILLKRNSKKYV